MGSKCLGKIKEEISNDIHKPLGKHIVTTDYEDTSLFHDIMTGRSITGILHLIIKPRLTGTPRSKLHVKQPPIDQSLWQLVRAHSKL